MLCDQRQRGVSTREKRPDLCSRVLSVVLLFLLPTAAAQLTLTPTQTQSRSPTLSPTRTFSPTQTASSGPCIVTAVGPVNMEGAPATVMQLWGPRGVTPDGVGVSRRGNGARFVVSIDPPTSTPQGFYVFDYLANVVRRYRPNGTLLTVAGQFKYAAGDYLGSRAVHEGSHSYRNVVLRCTGFGGDAGPASAAFLNIPWGITSDGMATVLGLLVCLVVSTVLRRCRRDPPCRLWELLCAQDICERHHRRGMRHQNCRWVFRRWWPCDERQAMDAIRSRPGRPGRLLRCGSADKHHSTRALAPPPCVGSRP